MSVEIGLILAILLVSLVLFVRETFPIEVTALLALGALLVTGLVTPQGALAGFSNKAVVAIGALLILSHALTRTGLIEAAATRLGQWAEKRQWLGIAVLLIAVALLSGFLNNTAIVAIFIPLVIKLCAQLKLSPSHVLLPLSYVSIVGGTLTLIGTSTNLLVSSIAQDAGQRGFGMFEFSALGLVFLVIGLAYTLTFARWLIPERVPAGDLTARYELGPYLTEVKIQDGSPLTGSTAQAAGIGREFDVQVLAILRGEERLTQFIGSLPLAVDDVLIVQAGVEDLLRLRDELGVALLPELHLSEADLSVGGLTTVEVLVAPNSRAIGRTIKQVDFRRLYGGFVMAIRRHARTMQQKVAHVVLEAWDSLLTLVSSDQLDKLRRVEGLIVLNALPLAYRRPRLWWLVLFVLPLVILLSALGVLEITAGAFLGVVVLLAARVLAPREAYGAVNWSVIFLIAAFVPVGAAVIDSGAADLLAQGVLRVADFLPLAKPTATLALIYLATSVLTQLVSNAAAAIILAPIAISVAATLGVDARPFLMAVCFAASAEFMTPIGYQTNLMVYSPGGYRFLDYTRFGAPLNLLFWLIATLLIPRIWPF